LSLLPVLSEQKRRNGRGSTHSRRSFLLPVFCCESVVVERLDKQPEMCHAEMANSLLCTSCQLRACWALMSIGTTPENMHLSDAAISDTTFFCNRAPAACSVEGRGWKLSLFLWRRDLFCLCLTCLVSVQNRSTLQLIYYVLKP
jgi:hypothetical protein